MFEQPADHLQAVLEIHEIAALAAVRAAGAVGFEQPHRPAGLDLRVRLADHAFHVALVVLVRAENIEEFQRRKPREQTLALGPQIEEMLGIAVGIERAQPVQRRWVVVETERAVAVGGRAGGVDEADAAIKAKAAQRLAVTIVVLHQVRGVALGGRGTGAQMDERLGRERVFAGLDEFEETHAVEIIGKAQAAQILPLLAGIQMVDDQDVVHAQAVELKDHAAADEPGPAGDDVHVWSFAARGARVCSDVWCNLLKL